MKGRPTQKTTHPNKNSLHKQFAQTILGQFVQIVPPFPFKLSRKQTKEFAQAVCASCFYLSGWFFGWVIFPWTAPRRSLLDEMSVYSGRGQGKAKLRPRKSHKKATKKPRKSHEKATKKTTKNAQTLFFQADEGHEKATEKPRKNHEKVTSKSVTSNEKSSEELSHP